MPTTVFDASATLAGTDDGNGNSNGNSRQLFAPAGLGAATGTQIRLTFLFGTAEGSEAAAVDAVYVGQKTTTTISSAAADSIFTGNQVQVTVSGSTSVNGSAAGVVVSDWITLGEAFDNTKGYMVSVHGGSGKTFNSSFATFSNTALAYASVPGASTASQTNPSLDQLIASTAFWISKIEIQAAGGVATQGGSAPLFASRLGPKYSEIKPHLAFPTSGVSSSVSVTEAATATDTNSSAAIFAASDSETGIAVDSPSAQAVFAVSDAEAGTATDTPTAGTSTPAAITEAATATETEAVTAVFAASQAEAGTATETDISTGTFTASQAEAGSATDGDSASAVFAASDTEAATATDAENTSFNDSVSEAATATEAESATVIFVAAATEAGSAAETPVAAAIFVAQATEAGTATDVEAGAAAFVASDTEAATASDAANAIIPGPPDTSVVHSLPFFATVGPMTSIP